MLHQLKLWSSKRTPRPVPWGANLGISSAWLMRESREDWEGENHRGPAFVTVSLCGDFGIDVVSYSIPHEQDVRIPSRGSCKRLDMPLWVRWLEGM